MDLAALFWDWIVHLDAHLAEFVNLHGSWVYALLFAIVFCETGLVVTPFLPGDSLLFVAGAVAAVGDMNVVAVVATLIAAALCGDNVNYWVGRFVGPRVFTVRSRWLNARHLQRAHDFYERHGGKTIILARFVPIVRTFAPFVAGIGAMTYGKFLLYNVVGGLAWVALCLGAGYLFGNIPWVARHFEIVVIGIIFVSLMPILYEVWK